MTAMGTRTTIYLAEPPVEHSTDCNPSLLLGGAAEQERGAMSRIDGNTGIYTKHFSLTGWADPQ